MKNYIVLDGKKIELSEETVKNLSESLKEKKYLQRIPFEGSYYITSESSIDYHECCIVQRPLAPNESHNRRTLRKALKFIQLQNFADEVNEEFEKYDTFLIYIVLQTSGDISFLHSQSMKEGVSFNSKEAAQKAIDYFGEEWIKDYLK